MLRLKRPQGSLLAREVLPNDRAPSVGQSGRGPARGVQDAPWLCPPFPASCPFRGIHHSVSGPRHIEPDRRISRITAHRSDDGAILEVSNSFPIVAPR